MTDDAISKGAEALRLHVTDPENIRNVLNALFSHAGSDTIILRREGDKVKVMRLGDGGGRFEQEGDSVEPSGVLYRLVPLEEPKE